MAATPAKTEQAQKTAQKTYRKPDVSQAVVPTEPDTTVTIAAVGDIMMYDEQLEAALQSDGTYDFTSSFAAVSGSTVSADLTVGNLELNFCGPPYAGKPDFRAPESLAKTLNSIGFDILQTANTYSIQNGLSGLRSTIQYLDAAGISHVGTYAALDDKTSLGGVLLKNVNGVKIAFIAYTKGLNYLTLPEGEEYAVDVLYDGLRVRFQQDQRIGDSGLCERGEGLAAGCDCRDAPLGQRIGFCRDGFAEEDQESAL